VKSLNRPARHRDSRSGRRRLSGNEPASERVARAFQKGLGAAFDAVCTFFSAVVIERSSSSNTSVVSGPDLGRAAPPLRCAAVGNGI
jgi:hypothetical protein